MITEAQQIEDKCKTCKYNEASKTWKFERDGYFWCLGCVETYPSLFFNNYEEIEEKKKGK